MRRAFFILTVLFTFMVAGNASARGVVIGIDELDSATKSALLSEIAKARQSDPQAFALLASVRATVATRDAHKRGRMAVITPALKGMGSRGVMPLLEELAVVAEPRGSLNETAWLAWRISLLEALGSQRDARAEATLVGVLESDSVIDFGVVRAAAQALGKLGSDDATDKLLALAKQPGPKQLAILAGLGRCRRIAAAQHLSLAISNADSARSAAVIARSLGEVGSAWAWETPVVAQSGEEEVTRSTAAEALVNAYVALAHPVARTEIVRAILIVDHPSTPSLIATHRASATGDLADALDALQQRFDHSPFH